MILRLLQIEFFFFVNDQILAKNTKQSLRKIEKDTERDYYLDALEAVDYGLIDQVIKK